VEKVREAMMRTSDAGCPGVCRVDRPLRRPAFTLIELLVVISIIALLVSILIPSLTRARAQAKSVTCLSNVRGMGQAGMTFAQEYNGRFQLAADPQAVNRVDPKKAKYAYSKNGELLGWPVAMAQAAGLTGFDNNYNWGVRANNWTEAKNRRSLMNPEFKLAICPADEVQISTPFYPTGASLQPLPAQTPPLPTGDRYWGYLSYGINEDIVGADDRNGPNSNAFDCWKDGCRGQIGAGPDGPCQPGDRLEGNLDRVFDPGTCLLMVDAGPDSEAQATTDPGGFANLIISAQANGPYLQDFQSFFSRRMPLKRHPESRVNVLFADFHGAAVRPVEFHTGDEVRRNLPVKYDQRVRVSPYRPWVD
jgi:prepilin-type N-terminal cleavage/methylation domain-containing protein/prepilin-type processing-associated H-X9-DG protein